MKRILIITDDFNELTFLETLLKKIGFDTLGIQSANQAYEQTMNMNPDMLILAETLKGVSTHKTLESLIGVRPNMFVILLKKDLKVNLGHVAGFINKVVKTPVDPLELIRGICQVAGLNEATYAEKYSKLGLFKGEQVQDPIKVSGRYDPASNTQFVKNANQVSENQEELRSTRFEKALGELGEPKSKAFSHKEALREVAEFRAREGDQEIIKIDEQRKGFVRALFKKK